METITVAESGKENNYESELHDWTNKEKAAVELINHIGNLLFEKSVELVLFRNHLVDVSISGILSLHEYAKVIVNKPIDIVTTSELAREITKIENLSPAKIDIGRLANEWLIEKNQYESKASFLNIKLVDLIIKDYKPLTPKDVVLYGFGRIGRIAARELIKQSGKGQQLRLRAIVTRGNSDFEIKKRAALLRMDSVHGPFPGTVIEDYVNKALIINGQIVKMIDAKSPEQVDYEAHGIKNALVIDNTGVFRDRVGLGMHLKSKGVSNVLLTAPGKGDIPNIVYGVNHKKFDIDSEQIFSAASCTTNAIVPVLLVLDESLKITKGHIETVHAYTNDQNLLDNYHKNERRGRAAAVNMVITETGAGKAVAKAIPHLAGKLTANAVRVPTPNGSLAIMSLTVEKETTREEVNAILKTAALEGELVNQIRYSIEEELVSTDIIGNTCCSVVDGPATISGPDKNSIVVYVWYDNEFGYTKQVIRLAKYISKVRRLLYY